MKRTINVIWVFLIAIAMLGLGYLLRPPPTVTITVDGYGDGTRAMFVQAGAKVRLTNGRGEEIVVGVVEVK